MEMMERYLNKAIVLGLKTEELRTSCKHTCQLIELAEDNHILIIPDDVVRLTSSFNDKYKERMMQLRGSLKVVGGKELQYTEYMFNECRLELLDLSEMITSKIRIVVNMFMNCKVKRIVMGNFNTSNVELMHSMFEGFETDELDLSTFNTSKVITMSRMFYKSKIGKLNISSFTSEKLISVTEMFRESVVDTIDLSWVDVSKLYDHKDVFLYANVGETIITRQDWLSDILFQVDCGGKITVID